MRPSVRRLGSYLGFSALALVLIGATAIVWGALLYGNLATTPSIPWALPALICVLWIVWRYLGGSGWPQSTSLARNRLLRANPVSGRALGWSIVAGCFGIAALAGLWVVLFRLFPMGANPLVPDRFASSPVMVGAIIVGASLLAPITEESAVRGYLQSRLERDLRPSVAVVLSSVVFAIAHISQGLAWPKLLFYFFVGVLFGVLALLNNSILPVIPVHVAGDLTFFLFVWPTDTARTPVSVTGTDAWFWLHVVQVIAFTAATIVAMRMLNKTGGPSRRAHTKAAAQAL